MGTVNGTVVLFWDRGNGETTVTYEADPPIGRHGQQNITVATSDVPSGLACGDSIQVIYDTPYPATITKMM